jgi:hypothetical protein
VVDGQYRHLGDRARSTRHGRHQAAAAGLTLWGVRSGPGGWVDFGQVLVDRSRHGVGVSYR